MSKRDFIALADEMRNVLKPGVSHETVIDALCRFMRRQNSAFMESRWRDYLAGACGPSGGKVKTDSAKVFSGTKKLKCPNCKSTNVTPAFGHRLNKCDSCGVAFD